MVRTQLYLTSQERDGLAALARATGRKQSELIREAVDRLIEQFGARRKKLVLNRAAGLWAKRKDLPKFLQLRSQWDRS
ncbi:MAG: ribbon-helix-helix domain-containing protein [Phycisphaerae bacterium]